MSDTPEFTPYEVPGIGTVTAHEGDTYCVLVASGAVHGYKSQSGEPSHELAAVEIAHAIANPPAFSPTVPASVTRRQLLLVLNANGVTRAAVRAMLAGNEAALIEFDEASEFRRDHPLVGQLGAALGKTEEQIDAMFIAASAL